MKLAGWLPPGIAHVPRRRRLRPAKHDGNPCYDALIMPPVARFWGIRQAECVDIDGTMSVDVGCVGVGGIGYVSNVEFPHDPTIEPPVIDLNAESVNPLVAVHVEYSDDGREQHTTEFA